MNMARVASARVHIVSAFFKPLLKRGGFFYSGRKHDKSGQLIQFQIAQGLNFNQFLQLGKPRPQFYQFLMI